jgi:hypothetical protein
MQQEIEWTPKTDDKVIINVERKQTNIEYFKDFEVIRCDFFEGKKSQDIYTRITLSLKNK